MSMVIVDTVMVGRLPSLAPGHQAVSIAPASSPLHRVLLSGRADGGLDTLVSRAFGLGTGRLPPLWSTASTPLPLHPF